MILADFKLAPAPRSRYYTRIRIFDTRTNMERAARKEAAMTGGAQACFDRVLPPLTGRKIGEIYLYDNPQLHQNAVHEITHAAVHYAREITGGNLQVAHRGEYASASEERLCRSMEYQVGEFCLRLARFKSLRRIWQGA